jgi:23S rRNA (uridine2552-2'-O)-methyltransferase
LIKGIIIYFQIDELMKKTTKAKNTSGRGQRDLKIKVKSARGKTVSQVKWLQRQLNDPYVKRAQLEGFRGRAAFKILELNEKYNFLIPGSKVVDLGCAPGGWSQVAVDLVNALGVKKNVKIGSVIGIDLQEVEVLPGAKFYQLDFMANDADLEVKNILEGKANVVMSDMAASSSGHKKTDHLRIMALCETAAYFAFDVLEEGGTFVAKVLAGGAESDLQTLLKQKFTKVYNVKPPSSRSDSSEKFVVALGFRG